jgi:hypothetical protein
LGNLAGPADLRHAFVHVFEAVAAAGGGGDPTAVVLDPHREAIGSGDEADPHLAGGGVLDHVVQAFLEGEEDVVADLGGKLAGGQVERHVEAAADAGEGEEFAGVVAEVVGQGVEGIVARGDGPDHLAHGADELLGDFVDPAQAFRAGGGRGGSAGRAAQQADAGQAGAELVVDVAGDPGALLFDRLA